MHHQPTWVAGVRSAAAVAAAPVPVTSAPPSTATTTLVATGQPVGLATGGLLLLSVAVLVRRRCSEA